MNDWTGGFGPGGQFAEWIQNMVESMLSGRFGPVGTGVRGAAFHHMDELALKSLKRHLEARRQDLDDVLARVDQELANRFGEPPANPT